MGAELLPQGEVWLVRHAETEWSVDGRHTGRTDIPLTAAGRLAAAQLQARLSDQSFARVLVSPLGRAVETANLAGVGAQAVASPDLMEWDYGEYEGITTARIREQRPAWSLWADGCPGGESAAEVGVRADRVIADVCETEGDTLLVAHGHLLRVLGARWLTLVPEAGARLSLGTGAICVLGQERGVRAVSRWGA